MLPPAYEDNRVWVATKAEHQGLLQMSRKPAVLTPNGDERNDEVGLEVSLDRVDEGDRGWRWPCGTYQVVRCVRYMRGLDGVGSV